MVLNSEDIRMEEDEREASPERFAMFQAPSSRAISRTVSRTSSLHPTTLERTHTHRTTHAATVGADHDGFGRVSTAASRKSQKPLPDFGNGKPYPPDLPEQEDYVVGFCGPDDPLHPQNWPMKKKLGMGAVVGSVSLTATFCSAIMSDSENTVAEIYGVSEEVGILCTSLFVLGYALGPIFWAPLSELYGRKLPIIVATFGFSVFTIGVATAENLQTIMICRFFAGSFGSAPLVLVSAVFADIFNNEQRGIAIAVFAATVIEGPLLAPFIGGFILDSYLGWRWTQYLPAIMGFACLIALVIFLEETYPPTILVSKASELRRRTKNWGIHAKQEEIEIDLKELFQKNLSRPLRILFTEPMVLFVTIYLAFLYGLLYLSLTAYALVFQGVYGFNAGVGGLPYFGFMGGVMLGFATIVMLNPGYVRKLKANNNIPVPEWRLPVTVVGGVAFAGGLFWLGWTGYQGTVPWIVPTLSGLLTGFGIYVVFMQMLNYIIDVYLMFAASAVAGNSIMRSLAGAIFPMFAIYMFDGIGIEWSLTLLGCFALIMVPIPAVFIVYGKRIRAKSKIAPALDIKQDNERKEGGDLESGGYSETHGNGEAGGGKEQK